MKIESTIPEELIDQLVDRLVAKIKPILAINNKKHDDTIFTKKTLAEYLHVSVKWVDGYKELGMPYYILKGHVRFRKSQIDKWLDSKEVSMINRIDRIMKLIK